MIVGIIYLLNKRRHLPYYYSDQSLNIWFLLADVPISELTLNGVLSGRCSDGSGSGVLTGRGPGS